ncbi:MAG TPA: hypothetical protein PLT68_04115 [Actinomycetota bacterium]|nr:hypothetical protein [Actinomycetota bacterium]
MATFLARWRIVVVAFVLGLLLAGAGTATAARLITSKDIKNGTIKQKDLSKPVRTKLNAPGPKGDTGAQGERGPAGPSWATAGTAGLTSTQNTPDLTGYTEAGYPQTFTLPESGPVLASTSVTIKIDCGGSNSPTYHCGTNWALAIDGKPLKGSGFGVGQPTPDSSEHELTLFGTLADLPAGEHTLRVYTNQSLRGGATGSVFVVSWAFSVQRVGSVQ